MKNSINDKVMKSVFFILIQMVLFSLTDGFAVAQSNRVENGLNMADSLTFEAILKEVVAHHPTVLKATEAIQIAEAGTGLARSTYFPDVDFGAGYTRIGPIPSITIPNMGSFDMAPADNFNASLNVRQAVYDFSKTKKNIEFQESSKEIATANVDLVKQRLALITAANFYLLVYFQDAIKIKELQIASLKEHLAFVNKKYETGSSTRYEILSTQVRISAAESQKVDAETSYENALTSLNSLLGLPSKTILKVKHSPSSQLSYSDRENMVDSAFNHRTEMLLSNLKQQHAELNLISIKAQNYPVLSAFATGGFKNGYFPELGSIKANYVAGLSLRVPIFTASRQKYQLMMARSDIYMAQQDEQQIKQDISTEVYQNDASLLAAKRKIAQSELQVKQAEEARALAEVSYKTGSLTNLDLLDAETLESESRLNLLKVQTEFNVNVFRLNISLGRPIF